MSSQIWIAAAAPGTHYEGIRAAEKVTMRFEEHCNRCELLLGERFEHVHHWLDAFAWVPGPTGECELDPYHRKHRHNLAGLKYVIETWGDAAR
jgi:hypothetical protein